MKEELITFETANLAKEKGFDVEVRDYYKNSSPNNLMKHKIYMNFNKYINLCVSAPTQTLLQKFLWEKYSIWVQSTPIFSSNECIGVTVTISSWKFPVIQVNYQGFDVYEGLEKGLQEALKLV